MTPFLKFCASHSFGAKIFLEGFWVIQQGRGGCFQVVPGKVLGRSKNILKKFYEHKNPGIMRQNGVLSIPAEGILGKFRAFRLAHI